MIGVHEAHRLLWPRCLRDYSSAFHSNFPEFCLLLLELGGDIVFLWELSEKSSNRINFLGRYAANLWFMTDIHG